MRKLGEIAMCQSKMCIRDRPRTVGQFEGSDVVIGAGRFGPYVLHNKKYVSLPKTENPLKVSLETAIAVSYTHLDVYKRQ